MRRLWKFLWSGGMDRSSFHNCYNPLLSENIIFLKGLALFLSFFFALLTGASFFIDYFSQYREQYLVCTILMLAYHFFLRFVKMKNAYLITAVQYIFLLFVGYFFIFLGTFGNPNSPAVVLLSLIILLPVLIADRAIWLILFLVHIEISFFYFAEKYKDPEVIKTDRFNIAIFTLLSLYLIFYFTRHRQKIHSLERSTKSAREGATDARQMAALSAIYFTVVVINLEDDTYHVLKSHPAVDVLLTGDHYSNAQKQLRQVCMGISELYEKDRVVKFVDFSDLPQRLKGVRAINCTFTTKTMKRCRARFIEVERNAEGKLTKVFFATEDVTGQE